MKTKAWLYNSIKFDGYVSSSDKSITELTNYIFDELSQDIKITSRKRQRGALKHIIVNGIISYRLNRPIHYSRDRSYYSHGKIYGQEWFRYHRIVPVIDWLVRNQYLEHIKGMYKVGDYKGLQSKFWAAEKLLKLFLEFRIETAVMERVPKENPIILKDSVPRRPDGRKIPKKDRSKPKPVSYRTTAKVRQMKNFLEEYNSFIAEQEITLELDGSDEVSIDFLLNLFHGELYGRSEILEIEYYTDLFTLISIPLHHTTQSIYYTPYIYLLYPTPYTYPHYHTHPLHTTYTSPHQHRDPHTHPPDNQTFSRKRTPAVGFRRLGFNAKTFFMETIFEVSNVVNQVDDKFEKSMVMKSKQTLYDIGITKIRLRLKHNFLHRIFNENSFDKGGRFYGGTHLGYPGDIRKKLKINGVQVAEPDYSGLHIRMLYHLKGIDYRDECYVYDKKEKRFKNERDKFKLVSLISINCEPYEAGIAIFNEFRNNGIEKAEDEKILEMIDVFKSFHEPIADRLFSGVGLDLQNLDSMIMESILKRLIGENIPALPVHDSVIVPAPAEKFTKQVMVEEYHKVMGFEPVI